MRSLWHIFKKQKSAANPEGRKDKEPASLSGRETANRFVFDPLPHICAITDVGCLRPHNEDAYCVSPDYSWFAVADGMGGHDAGEVAASLAIQALVEHITPERMATAAAANSVGTLLLDAVTEAHGRVLEANHGNESGRAMGCTLAVGSIANGLISCNVGDVRCYILHEGVLRQVSRDHSTVGALVEAGVLTQEQARVHPDKNQVLQAIGMLSGVKPDVHREALSRDDRILICSDGLWEAMPHEELQAIIAGNGTMHELATQAADRAIEAGGHDNITMVLCQITSEQKESEQKDAEDTIPQIRLSELWGTTGRG
jgi:PPM family protein phosphatase